MVFGLQRRCELQLNEAGVYFFRVDIMDDETCPVPRSLQDVQKVLDGLAGLSPANIVALNLFLSDVSFHSNLD